ncbi:MAG: hypothetical protein ACXV5Q_01945 [Frankiaceae bacterium]
MRLRTARLRTALGRTPERSGPGRGFTPVEQVLRAPVRPLLRHVHHHLSSTNLQLRVAVGVRVAAASHPIRLQAVPRPPARGPIAAAATYPGVVFRDQVPPPAAAMVAGQPARPPVSLVHTVSLPASPARAISAVRAGYGTLPPVELVHRLPAPSAPASGAAAHRPADARANGTAARASTRWAGPGWADTRWADTRWADTRWAGPGWAGPGVPATPGAAPLTAADVPGVVDQVVREIDRRVVAARERRGWTA